jgi:hypothetical protein
MRRRIGRPDGARHHHATIEELDTVDARILRLLAGSLLIVVALAVAACSTAASAAPTTPAVAPFPLRTAPVQPQACMDALIGGTLARNPASGLGIANADEATAVEWPFRYSARSELGRIVLVDETGKVVAREGDEITVGGGFGNQFWHACAPVTVTRAAT